MAGIYLSQTSVIYFCWGFSCCPYYRGVRNSEVSAKRELTVHISMRPNQQKAPEVACLLRKLTPC